ncbi:perlucin-like protein [Mytilus trossulus]|uniref:perlucin-like protein n=1 Tax=Mytilus trossulus TaxID=6551 RepID=UPI003007509C
MQKSIWLIYQILNLKIVFNACEIRKQNYEVVQNTKFSSLSSNKIVLKNFSYCALTCLSDGNCCAASYLESFRECYLVDNDNCYDSTETENGWVVLRIKLLTKSIFTVPKTWIDAQDYCDSWGGRLATVSSPSENEYMLDMTDRTQPVWIGGTDGLIEGQWKWHTSTNSENLITKFYWGSNQPNNYNNQDCLAYYKLNAIEYKWADEDCNTMYQFICEK